MTRSSYDYYLPMLKKAVGSYQKLEKIRQQSLLSRDVTVVPLRTTTTIIDYTFSLLDLRFKKYLTGCVLLTWDGISGHCSCGDSRCLHGEAALYQACTLQESITPATPSPATSRPDEPQPEALSPALRQLLDGLNTGQSRAPVAAIQDHLLVYRLLRDGLELIATRRLKSGAFSIRYQPVPWSVLGLQNNFNFPVSAFDRRIFQLVAQETPPSDSDEFMAFSSFGDPELLFTLLTQERRLAMLFDRKLTPLTKEGARQAGVRWERKSASQYELRLNVPTMTLLESTPPWYFDGQRDSIGPLSFAKDQIFLGKLMQTQQVFSPEELHVLKAEMTRRGYGGLLQLPRELSDIDHGPIQPAKRALLIERSDRISPSKVRLELSFQYPDGPLIPPAHAPTRYSVERDGQRHWYSRDEAFEECELEDLVDMLGNQLDIWFEGSGFNLGLMSATEFDEYRYYKISASDLLNQLPSLLEDLGWEVTVDGNMEQFRSLGAGTIHARVSDTHDEQGWLSVTLNVQVNGVEFDLLPVLRTLMASDDFIEALRDPSFDGSWRCLIGEHDQVISLPMSELRPLGLLLLEISDSHSTNRPLRISRFNTSLIDAMGDRVQGADSLALLHRVLTERAPPINQTLLPASVRLRDYQVDGVSWMRARLAAGVGVVLEDEMGLGKTIQTLSHIWLSLLAGETKPSLIVAPPTVMSRWQEEIEKFFPTIAYQLHHGTARYRTAASLVDGVNVVLTSYMTLAKDIELFSAVDWHIVAMDEAHDINNAITIKYKACHGVRADQKIAISGTIVQNREQDLWSAMNITTPGLLREITWFRRHFVLGAKRDDGLRSERRAMMRQITAPFRLRRLNAEVRNELPELVQVPIMIEMGQLQKEIYNTAKAALVDRELRDLIIAKGLSKSGIHVLTAITKLRQICCDPRLTKLSNLPTPCPSAKLERLMNEVENFCATGSKVVIASYFTSMLDLIEAEFVARNIPVLRIDGDVSVPIRKQRIAAFRQGDTQFILVSGKVGGVGIELPEASYLVLYDPWWNPAATDQLIGRLRRGKHHPQTTVLSLLTVGTLEERVMEIADRKRAMINSLGAGETVINQDDHYSHEDLITIFGPGFAKVLHEAGEMNRPMLPPPSTQG